MDGIRNMDPQNTKSEYLLLFRGDEWYNRLSPEELQKVMSQSQAWFDRLNKQGLVRGAQALGRSGSTVLNDGRILADGPFAESKEVIGGYLLLQVDSEQEAVAIAKSNPSLAHGTSIEVRPVAPECPLDTRAREVLDGKLLAVA